MKAEYREVISLLRKGYSIRDMAKLSGRGVSTVRRVKRLKIHNHSNKTINFTFFSKKGLCNSGLKARSTTFVNNIKTEYNGRNNITVDKAVQTIKGAILRAQAQASQSSNAIQLSLYYGIGRYVSINLRQAHWGAKALDTISERLQRELPGLRGFSSGNLKKMRIFYEEWQCLSIGSPLANQLQQLENKIEEGVEIGEKYA